MEPAIKRIPGAPHTTKQCKGDATMPWVRPGAVLAGSVLAGLMAVPLTAPAPAQQQAGPPDFSSNFAGWVGFNGGGPFFEPVPGRLPGPVASDPAHLFVPNGVGKQPTFRIADLTNPNLKPWVKDTLAR